MAKAFVTSALVISVVLGGALAAGACSPDGDSTFGDPPKPDAAEDGPSSPLLPDAAGDATEAGPSSCSPAIPPAFAPTWKAPVKAAACSGGDIQGYYDACLADSGKTEPNGTCAKWKTDHAACSACAEPVDKSGPIQWQLNRTFWTLNVAGCISLQQGPPEAGATSCGEAYNAAVQCTRESCESCFTIGGTYEQFSDCQTAAKSVGVCKSYQTAEASTCAGYASPGQPSAQCIKGAENLDVLYKRVIGIFCGT